MSESTAEPDAVARTTAPARTRKPAPSHERRVNRSRPFRGWRKAVACVPIVMFLSYVTWSHVSWGMSSQIWFLSTFFAFIAIMITYFLISGVFWRSFTQYPPAAGRVIAIVPVYNEEPELVHEVVESLLRQTILPDIIYVVDDGSRVPIPPYDDKTGLVHWLRQDNGGKREAQANALRRHHPDEFDFVLTVDSDSVCDDDALEHLLRSMRDERVHAATGMVFVRNWSTNFLTRLTDINVITSCLLFRMSRSILGVVSPCSGALALYRAPVVYDNLDDYIENAKIGGGAGDDRRLSFYALLRGQVVGVSEAVVETQLPERWGACFRQRMRWSKSAWLGVGFVMTNLRPLVVFFYVFPLLFALLWPFVVATLITIAVRYHVFTIFNGILFWEVCAVTQTWIYAAYRPGFTLMQKVKQYAYSPLYPLLGLIILRPAAYWSLTKLHDNSWLTRESSDQAHPTVQVEG